MEWECCIKNLTDGAIEGAEFIKKHIIKKADKAFEDFAWATSDENLNKQILGLK